MAEYKAFRHAMRSLTVEELSAVSASTAPSVGSGVDDYFVVPLNTQDPDVILLQYRPGDGVSAFHIPSAATALIDALHASTNSARHAMAGGPLLTVRTEFMPLRNAFKLINPQKLCQVVSCAFKTGGN